MAANVKKLDEAGKLLEEMSDRAAAGSTGRLVVGTEAEALRLEMVALAASGEAPDVVETGSRAADMIEAVVRARLEDEGSGHHTTAGIQARHRTRAEALDVEAERIDRRAVEIERALEATFEQVWARLTRPAADLFEYTRLSDMVRRLQAEDPVVREQLTLAAARNGHDDVLRALLTQPQPPIDVGENQRWHTLLTPELVDKVKEIVRERVSPQGPDAWRAQWLRTVARRLRNAVTSHGLALPAIV